MLSWRIVESLTQPPPHTHRRRWIWIGTSLTAAVVIVLALLAAVIPLSSDSLRHRLVSTLSDRFDSDVSLGDLHLRIFPRLHVEGETLIVRQRGRAEVPPLITVKSFSVDADLIGLMHKHVAHVQLEGLDIEIPPDRHPNDDEASRSKDARGGIATGGRRRPARRTRTPIAMRPAPAISRKAS